MSLKPGSFLHESVLDELAVPREPQIDSAEHVRELTAQELIQERCGHDWVLDYDGIGQCRKCGLQATLAQIKQKIRDSQDVLFHESVRQAADVEWIIDEEGRRYQEPKKPPLIEEEEDPLKERKGIPTTALDLRGRTFTDYGTLVAQRRFLDAFKEWGTIRAGCKYADISRKTFEGWMSRDVAFRGNFEEAVQEYNDLLKVEIHRRAVQGVPRTKKVFYRGELVDEYQELEYSDNLLMFHAKSKMPEYRDRVAPDEDAKGQIPWEAVRDLWTVEDGGARGLGGGTLAAESYADLNHDEESDVPTVVAEDVVVEASSYQFKDAFEDVRAEMDREEATS